VSGNLEGQLNLLIKEIQNHQYEVVCSWVKTAWWNVELDVIKTSIVRAGIHSNFEELYITRHDILGAHFKSLWVTNASKQINVLLCRKEKRSNIFARRLIKKFDYLLDRFSATRELGAIRNK